MEVTKQNRLSFLGVDIINVQFDAIKSYEAGVPINIDIKPSLYYPKEFPTEFRILLTVTLTCDGYYDMKVAAMGYFKVEGDDPQSILKQFANANAPAIVFPYLRSFISTFSSNIGQVTGLISLPPQFFVGEIPVMTDEEIEAQSNLGKQA